jgi:hypothetical protein
MSILKNFRIILMGLAATVCQAEIAIEVPPPETPFENPTVPSGEAPSEIKLKVEPLRLAIDLVDGSHIIGVPSITSVPIQTSFAKMDIPLEKIVSIEIKDDHETASFELNNGDKLKGVCDLKPLQLETVFGQASVSIEHVTRIAVLSGESPGGLVLHYSFDKDDQEVADQSGKGNTAAVHGAKWTPTGKVGGAYEFDGTDDWIDCGQRQSLLSSRTVTYCAWVKPELTTDKNRGIIVSDKDFNDGFNLYEITTGGGTYRVYADINSNHKIYAGPRITVDAWTHLAATYDGSSIRLYVNGTQHHDGLSARGAITGSTRLRIGGDTSGEVSNWRGMIDEVMVFNRALSEQEIKQVYSLQK